MVYKPRDLALDVAFHQALEDLNVNSDLPPFLTLKFPIAGITAMRSSCGIGPRDA